MKATADVIAFQGPSIDEVRELTEGLLGLTFEASYSEAWGGDYWSTPSRAPRVAIHENFLDDTDTRHFEDRPDITAFIDSDGLSPTQVDALVAAGGTVMDHWEG